MGFEIDVVGTPGTDAAFKVASRTPATALGDLAPEYRQLIDGAYTVTLATHGSDGRAMLSPMWFAAHRDGVHVEVNTVVGRVKDRQLQREPRLSIQIINNQNPYHWITIYGRAADRIQESDAARGHLATESIDNLAELYVNQRPYPFRADGEERVLYLVEPTKIVTFGAP